MEKQILEIVKQRDEYQFSAELNQNAKGEVQITCKIRTDIDSKQLPETLSLMLQSIALNVKKQGFKIAGESTKPEVAK